MSPDDPQAPSTSDAQDATSTSPLDTSVVRELDEPTPLSPPLPDSTTRDWLPGIPRVGLIGAAVAAGLFVLYLIAVVASGGGVKAGTNVLGVDVGGLSRAEAVQKLDDALATRAGQPLDVVVVKRKFTVDPAVAGLALDSGATVDSVSGRTWNPLELVRRVFVSESVAPVVAVNEAQLGASIAKIAATVDKSPVEPGILLVSGTPTLRTGKSGVQVDQPASVTAVSTSYLVSTTPVTLPTASSTPTVSDDQARSALAGIATPAVAAPVQVIVNGPTSKVQAVIPPSAIANALSFTVVDAKIAPALDGNVLKASIASAVAPIEEPGREARFKIVSGKPRVVPSKVGVGVAPAGLAAAVLPVLSKAADRTVTVPLASIAPTLTTAQAKAMGITEKLSSFTQPFPYAAYRVQNIGQAAKYMNGTLLAPGDTYSMNNTIKERTVANGYTVGIRIGADGHFVEDLGGGVSTITTATWTTAFYAGMERVEQRAHSIYISRYRAGLEATVAWGSLDLRFRNDSGHGVLITTVMRNSSITVSMWGTKKYSDIQAVSGPRYDVRPPKTVYNPLPTCLHQAPQDGFKIDVARVFYQNGVEVRREKLTSSYRPSDEVICKPDPSKVTPSPSGSGSGIAPKPSASTTP